MKQYFFAAALALIPAVAMAEEAATITPEADVLTMINVWTPAEGQQAAFIAMLETALSRELSSPQPRVMIEFSFAFSPGTGRSLNVWTHEPEGRDASTTR